ncbi:MAG: RNA-binding protein [Firmicutes bacterium]|nr:RNA-binding protein [Bacillota bacterium]
MNDDALLIARLEDKAAQAADRYMITAGDFLDSHQRRIAEEMVRAGSLPAATRFYGGFEDAERSMPVFLPDYAGEEDLKDLVRVIRVSCARGGRKLSHRDYLGSLLSLGIDRGVTGDILVRDEESELGPGADIIVETAMADFIQMNYAKAGHTWLSTEVLPIDQLHITAGKAAVQKDTVASLRLDSVTASAFRMSRAKAAEAIRRGLVSVNSMEALKTDQALQEGDKIVLRGKGRVILSEVGGSSRKDRIRVAYQVFR